MYIVAPNKEGASGVVFSYIPLMENDGVIIFLFLGWGGWRWDNEREKGINYVCVEGEITIPCYKTKCGYGEIKIYLLKIRVYVMDFKYLELIMVVIEARRLLGLEVLMLILNVRIWLWS